MMYFRASSHLFCNIFFQQKQHQIDDGLRQTDELLVSAEALPESTRERIAAIRYGQTDTLDKLAVSQLFCQFYCQMLSYSK